MREFWLLLVGAEYALLIAVVALMLWRRLQREFPLLFGYFIVVLLAAIVQDGFSLRFSSSSLQYFYAYWLTEAATVMAAFVALYEVFLVRLFPSSHTTPVYRYLFPTVVVVAIVLATFTLVHAPRRGPNMLSVVVGETTLAVDVLQVGLLVFFFLIVLAMGRGWEWHEFGIALGFGVYALTKLVTYVVRAKAGYARTPVDNMPAVGYFAALVIWLIYLSRKYKRPDINIPMELVGKATSWNKLLRDVTGRRR